MILLGLNAPERAETYFSPTRGFYSRAAGISGRVVSESKSSHACRHTRTPGPVFALTVPLSRNPSFLFLSFHLVCITREARRKRTPISPSQRCVLIQAFERNRFPGIVTREELARQTGIPECRIQVRCQCGHTKGLTSSGHSPARGCCLDVGSLRLSS